MLCRNRLNYFLKQCFYRFYSINEIRVRFAPSPTGFLHLGGLRTALYNYLFAKSRGGIFILRVEDTDQTRIITGAVEQLQEDLNWVGITVDEGPNIGGKYGPYIQSQRLNIYSEQVQILLGNGSAYQCFCTNKRLSLLRKEALRIRQIPKYDNRCRYLSRDDVKKRIDRGDKYCIRFKLFPDCEAFEDMICGNIAYDVTLNEGDPIIMKADGFPTYHFANVVDDHFMKITHVLRGVEWQISTTKHILMYRAFQWKPPSFGHLPLLLNSDGTKLSKRQGDIKISEYRKSGVFPQALINFVTSCGGGFDKQQAIKPESYTMGELIRQFDVNRINTHSTKMTPEKLPEFNRLELVRLLKNEEISKELVKNVQDLIKSKFPGRIRDGSLQIDENYIKLILNWTTSRINKLSDLVSKELLFLWIMPSCDDSVTEEDVQVITTLAEALIKEEIKFSKHYLKEYFKEFALKRNVSFKKLMKITRTAISGLKEGPGVAEMMEILGKDNTLLRLSEFIRKHNK